MEFYRPCPSWVCHLVAPHAQQSPAHEHTRLLHPWAWICLLTWCTGCILELTGQHSIASLIRDDVTWAAFVPDPGSENGPWWEQTALSIFVFFSVSFLTLGWIKLKKKKLCLTKHKTSKTHQFVPLGAQGIASAVESYETEQGLLFWQEKPGRAQKLMEQEKLIFQVRKGK